MSASLSMRGKGATMVMRSLILATALGVSDGALAAKADLDYERLRSSLAQLKGDAVLGGLAPAEISLAQHVLEQDGEQPIRQWQVHGRHAVRRAPEQIEPLTAGTGRGTQIS